MIKINVRGAKTLADARPLVIDGQFVYVVVGQDVASLHMGGQIVAERPAFQIRNVIDAQDWAYETIERKAAEAAETEEVVNNTPDMDAVADAVYGGDVPQIRANGEAMLAESVSLAARAALPFKIKGRTVPVTDPRHPARAAKTLEARARVLIAWTARDEMDYSDYVSGGIGSTDGWFAPMDRSAWKRKNG